MKETKLEFLVSTFTPYKFFLKSLLQLYIVKRTVFVILYQVNYWNDSLFNAKVIDSTCESSCSLQTGFDAEIEPRHI